eukprot:864171-Alexandrium_andersonii.AAC.1
MAQRQHATSAWQRHQVWPGNSTAGQTTNARPRCCAKRERGVACCRCWATSLRKAAGPVRSAAVLAAL